MTICYDHNQNRFVKKLHIDTQNDDIVSSDNDLTLDCSDVKQVTIVGTYLHHYFQYIVYSHNKQDDLYHKYCTNFEIYRIMVLGDYCLVALNFTNNEGSQLQSSISCFVTLKIRG